MRLAFLLGPCLGFVLDIATPARSEIDTDLRSWILQNVIFEKDASGNERLLLRRNQVRAQILIDDQDIANDARTTIANFAEAFGLEYRFTSLDINMLVVAADNVTDGNKLNISLLRRLGFSEYDANYIAKAPDIVSESRGEGWSDGCGGYISRDEKHRHHLVYGIVFSSKDRPVDRQKRCITSIIALSFGLRARIRDLLRSQNDYLPLLLMGRSAKECDKEIEIKGGQNFSRDVLIDCISAKLKRDIQP